MALPQRGAPSRFLERVMLIVERPVNWIVGAPQVNPFYYTGPIAIFLFAVISITGIFLVLFFQVGFDSSYLFISRVEHQPLARIVRAAHRYASDAFVIVSILHALRLLAQNRFRGARWLAWVSGIAMVFPVWLAGVTGYQLIWDERALAITVAFDNILRRGAMSAPNLLAAEGKGNDWIFIMIVLLAHLLLSALIGVAIWVHLARLNRAKWLPENYWLIGLTVVVLGVSIFAPVGMVAKANLQRAPGSFPIDLLYLFYLPAAFDPIFNSTWVWIGLIAFVALCGLLPWLSFRKTASPKIAIDKAQCTGCTLCAVDCPYKAITMEPRTDGRPHKFIAIEHPDLCVACGICIGACDGNAIALGNVSTPTIWNAAMTRLKHAPRAEIVLTCERHAVNGAQKFLSGDANVQVIALPCVGMIYPDLVGRIRQAGARAVRVIGCPPEDCANREGNAWAEGRITRQRLPRLRKQYDDEPIALLWIAPDTFANFWCDRNFFHGQKGSRNFLYIRVLLYLGEDIVEGIT
ncbi:MAG: hydrogenase iron-sulfur subunit [Chloroflexi bacterium]|nr:hydrogenase iron-sulfur subunit [Chloroflexota bacterium]